VAYTLSTSRDDASSPGATEYETNVPQNVRNIFAEDGEWANSSFDHRHQIVASGTYQLAGFRLSGVFFAQAGAPFTVNLGVDQANIGTGPAQRPNQSGDPTLPGDQQTPQRWFDTSVFSLPAPFTFGSARRNSVLGPDYANLDAVLARTFRLGGPATIELRWEVFNVLNRTNFDIPNRTFGTANFGRIFPAKPSREMQFGARLSF